MSDTATDLDDGISAEIEAVLSGFSAQLAALMWTAQDGTYRSPVFATDPVTGAWGSVGTGGTTLSGDNLGDLFAQAGQGLARAVMDFAVGNPVLLQELTVNQQDSSNFAMAVAFGQGTAAQAFEALYAISAATPETSARDIAVTGLQAASAAEAMLESFTDALPALAAMLDQQDE